MVSREWNLLQRISMPIFSLRIFLLDLYLLIFYPPFSETQIPVSVFFCMFTFFFAVPVVLCLCVEKLWSHGHARILKPFSIFNRMGFWRTLCLQSNIEEDLSFCLHLSESYQRLQTISSSFNFSFIIIMSLSFFLSICP